MNKEIVKVNGKLGRIYEDNSDLKFSPAKRTHEPWSRAMSVTEDMVEKTTKDEKIEYLKYTFHWGEINGVHEFNNGEYVLLGHLRSKSKEQMYSAYLNFEDISRSYFNLDSALIGLMEHKYQGLNSQAGMMFERMLEMDKLEKKR